MKTAFHTYAAREYFEDDGSDVDDCWAATDADLLLLGQGRDKIVITPERLKKLRCYCDERFPKTRPPFLYKLPLPNSKQLGAFIMTLLLCFVFHKPLTQTMRQAGHKKPWGAITAVVQTPVPSPFPDRTL